MRNTRSYAVRLSTLIFAVATSLLPIYANADAVTDWNNYALLAVKGGSSTTTGTASIALNSNVLTRISAIQARAVFDAVNVFDQFSPQRWRVDSVTGCGGYHPWRLDTGNPCRYDGLGIKVCCLIAWGKKLVHAIEAEASPTMAC